jgi:hypothetical protein
MKKGTTRRTEVEMLDEYDFSKGVRGKYAARYAEGSNIVVLPPDLADVFPTSKSVEDALRGLIALARRTTKTRNRRKNGGSQ